MVVLRGYTELRQVTAHCPGGIQQIGQGAWLRMISSLGYLLQQQKTGQHHPVHHDSSLE
ncbi:hypothetical protein ACRRTK_017523 [Alexandromys fortis]